LFHAYFADRNEDEQRRKIVIPDTAHGTNPASVTMAGYELTNVRTDPRGNIDIDDLRAKVDEHTAGLMLTNPSTLGLFDENIEEITRIFHGVGALMYYDGANLNAVCGISRPGDMGFDIVHINLHKTFSQPHGGGGPGGGPIAVGNRLEPTETEAKETLDAFADAMLEIAREAAGDPELLKDAPHGRPVGRLDEVRAAKRPIVRYQFDEHPHLAGEPAAAAVEAPKGA